MTADVTGEDLHNLRGHLSQDMHPHCPLDMPSHCQSFHTLVKESGSELKHELSLSRIVFYLAVIWKK